MSLVFTAFYAALPGGPPRTEEYLGYIKCGRQALAKTNPNAKYVVLTDQETAPALEKHVEVAVTAPSGVPLMIQYIAAQVEYLRTAADDYVILAGTDCVARKPLADATRLDHGCAVTYRDDSGNINNVGYSRDHELTAWFLARAQAILAGWPADKQSWFGDQESWEAALGEWGRTGAAIHVAKPEGRNIHLYPCSTHNRPVRKNGTRKEADDKAYILHFKGPRKNFLAHYVEKHILRQ